jgi:hypothetical protein
MSQMYLHTKASVNSQKLIAEIAEDETIVTAMAEPGIEWESPDTLKTYFASSLSGEEEDALDVIVAAHDGHPMTTWEWFCYACGKNLDVAALTKPTQCAVCDSTDIQDKYHRENLIATSNPTTSDDETKGYCIGSKWDNLSTGEVWECIDASEGEAIWKLLSYTPPA